MTNQHDPSAPIPDMPENEPGAHQPGAQPSGSVPAPADSTSAAAPAQPNPQTSAQQPGAQPASSLVDRLAQNHQLTDVDHELRTHFGAVSTATANAVVGQGHATHALLIALLTGGHVLLEGVPGVAKTLLVRALSHAVELDHARIQFTPDLMPSDVTGSTIYDAKTGDFEFRPGPVFTNILIADEINRTPPKTQSALLEAMEEKQVSVDGNTYSLPQPFLVAATQNPIEYDGTYPLPEAQLDRFLFKVQMNLPQRDAELDILQRHAGGFAADKLADAGVTPQIDAEGILAARERVADVYCAPEVLGYIVDLVQATRQAPSLELGVSPRGATRLLSAARAHAWLYGRAFITPDDIKFLVPISFRHRVRLNPEAHMDGLDVDDVLESIVSTVAVPR